MTITYDPQVDAAYMYFTEDEDTCVYAAESSEEYPFIVFDYDADNKVIGIEFLQVSKVHPQLLKRIANDLPRT